MGEKEKPGRGRPGEKRYINKRETTVDFKEFKTLIEEIKIENLVFRSLVTILYYLGIRIAEICGDGKRTWKKLTNRGVALSNAGELQKDWEETEEGDLWYWKHRDPLPGIVKEDITLRGNILRISSKPLKRGKREGPGGGLGALELDVRYPYVDLIVMQWKRTKPKEKVWDITTWKAWNFISKISDGRLYPHAFRLSRATVMARNPEMSIADLKYWFGWARGTTADAYILPTRSVIKAREALAKEIPPELIRRD